MLPLGITSTLRDKNRLEFKKRSRSISTIFIIACLLPFIVFSLFAFDILKSKPALSSGMEKPVAKVITPTGIGTAFLISETKLLTARHVVNDMNIGDEVILDFQKADPPIQINGKILFFQKANITPYQTIVPLDYFLTDVAVLEIQERDNISPVDLGDSDFIEELDEVILVGYPNDDYSKTDGKINSKQYHDLDLFKSDVTANRGNSGGPAFSKDDLSVIGIIVGSGNPNDQGENVIMKINNVIQFLESHNIDIY